MSSPFGETATNDYESAGIRYHVVQPGETLSTISRIYYGTDEHWATIYHHNSAYIHNPNQLFPHMRLAIPYLPSDTVSVRFG